MRKCLSSLISILNNEQNRVLKANRLRWTQAVKEGKREKNEMTRTKVGRVPGNKYEYIYNIFKTLKLQTWKVQSSQTLKTGIILPL